MVPLAKHRPGREKARFGDVFVSTCWRGRGSLVLVAYWPASPAKYEFCVGCESSSKEPRGSVPEEER